MKLKDKYGYTHPCIYLGEESAVVIDRFNPSRGFPSMYSFVWKQRLPSGRWWWVVSGFTVDPEKGIIEFLGDTSDEFKRILFQFVEDWPDIKPILQKNLLKEML